MPKTHIIAIDDHPRSPARIEADIDFESGEITGLVATGMNEAYALHVLRDTASEDQAHFDWQQSYPAPDALHNPKSLAWHLLARGWKLQGALEAYPPPLPDPHPEGTLA